MGRHLGNGTWAKRRHLVEVALWSDHAVLGEWSADSRRLYDPRSFLLVNADHGSTAALGDGIAFLHDGDIAGIIRVRVCAHLWDRRSGITLYSWWYGLFSPKIGKHFATSCRT